MGDHNKLMISNDYPVAGDQNEMIMRDKISSFTSPGARLQIDS